MNYKVRLLLYDTDTDGRMKWIRKVQIQFRWWDEVDKKCPMIQIQIQMGKVDKKGHGGL